MFCYEIGELKQQFYLPCLFLVALGSIAELPAESCAEIKASEGEDAVSGNYWFSSIKPDEVVLASCNMSTEGKWTFF